MFLCGSWLLHAFVFLFEITDFALQFLRGHIRYVIPGGLDVDGRSSGALLIDVCADEHMPTVIHTLQWIKENPEFATLYRDSINDRLVFQSHFDPEFCPRDIAHF